MITRVESASGEVLHDCIALGCAVSWDGEIIDAAAYQRDHGAPDAALSSDDASASSATAVTPGPVAAGRATADAQPASEPRAWAEGDAVPGATKPDLSQWNVRGSTATLREDS